MKDFEASVPQPAADPGAPAAGAASSAAGEEPGLSDSPRGKRGPDLTRWLQDWQDGDAEAGDRLFEIVYRDLRRLAGRHLGRKDGLTLQPTELVHEAYFKIQSSSHLRWDSRLQFYGFAARVLRHVLVDRMRHGAAAKRDRGALATGLDLDHLAAPAPDVDIVALDQALGRLAAHDAEAARVVELRYFGGLTVPEVAELMGLGTATVTRRWNMARAWLRQLLTEVDGDAAAADSGVDDGGAP